jgi:23S rRNA pseudouridine2605 synthase
VINLGDSHSWFRVVVHEGRNREVRRLWESQGLEVSRLKRTRYGNIELPRELRRGHHQALEPEQVKACASRSACRAPATRSRSSP